jgi:hypothetical protein
MTRVWASTGVCPASVASMLVADDVDALAVLGLDSYDADCPPGFYEDRETMAFSVLRGPRTIIDAAAFYGAVRCFRFLVLSRARINAQTMLHAIAGGSAPIVRLCEQNGAAIESMPHEFADIAAAFFRYDLLEWLADFHPVRRFCFHNVSTHLSPDFFDRSVSRLPLVSQTFFLATRPAVIASTTTPKIAIPPSAFAAVAEELMALALPADALFGLCNSADDLFAAIKFASPVKALCGRRYQLSGLIALLDEAQLAAVEALFIAEGVDLLNELVLAEVVESGNEALAIRVRDFQRTFSSQSFNSAVSMRMTKFVRSAPSFPRVVFAHSDFPFSQLDEIAQMLISLPPEVQIDCTFCCSPFLVRRLVEANRNIRLFPTPDFFAFLELQTSLKGNSNLMRQYCLYDVGCFIPLP